MGKIFNDHFAVIDLETLGIGSSSCILSLGLTVSAYNRKDVTFDDLIKEGLYLKFDLREQLAMGRTRCNRVIEWWYDQTPAAKAVLKPTPQDVSINSLSKSMVDYFESKDLDIMKVDFYDRNSFDLSKLQDFIESKGDKVPWNYKQVFEITTALRFNGFDRYAGVKVEDFPGAVYHNALHDAAVDHMRMMKMFHE